MSMPISWLIPMRGGNCLRRLPVLLLVLSLSWTVAQGGSPRRQSRNESAGLHLVKTMVASDSVVIFARSNHCPLCVLVRTMFRQLGELPVVVNVDKERNGRGESIEKGLREVLGRSAPSHAESVVPQVFIDGEHVGGFQELLQLYESGNLERLLTLKQAGG